MVVTAHSPPYVPTRVSREYDYQPFLPAKITQNFGLWVALVPQKKRFLQRLGVGGKGAKTKACTTK